MLKGFDENGNLKNIKVTEEGAITVQISSGEEDSRVVTESKETTLYAGVITANTSEQTIGVNKKVTQISIANYSESANVLVSVDDENYTIAPNIALDLPINKTVSLVGLSATENDTKVQYVIKGEE